jgi:hypothetical protein
MARINRPGKFEGECEAVEYFWENLHMSSDDFFAGDTLISVFIIEDEDRARFPEDLEGVAVLVLWETEQGFVCSRSFETLAAYEDAREKQETENAEYYADEDLE